MHPALEFIGKVAATFDVCVLSFIVGCVATLLLAGRVRERFKLPEWTATVVIMTGCCITVNVGMALAKWVWTWKF